MNDKRNAPTQPPGPDEEGLRRLHAGPDTHLLEQLREENRQLREAVERRSA